MFKYLELCVELKKSHIAKEGLFQYRNMFQLVSDLFNFQKFFAKNFPCLKFRSMSDPWKMSSEAT